MERLIKTGTVRPVHSSMVENSPIGLGFEKLDRGAFDPSKAYDRVAEAGVKWARLQSGWARTEKERGRYDFAWLDEVVDNLLRRGVAPWLCLCYGNPLYSPAAREVYGAVGIPPIFTEEERAAWKAYVEATVRHFRGRVHYYEVWNEPDGVWCWKHGPNGTEYGEFLKATGQTVKEADPDAVVVGGSTCLGGLDWLKRALDTGAAAFCDAITYHDYDSDELRGELRVKAIEQLVRLYNPRMMVVQGETGTQSRSDGAGALAGFAWTPLKQAKFMARHTVHDMLIERTLTSYFSCMDMAEALNGKVGDAATYKDYGYFGVLAADFDSNGVATGEYTPKPSYRTLQVMASVFREEFYAEDLPLLFLSGNSPRANKPESTGGDLVHGGFRKPNRGAAFVWWRPADILTETYEGTVSVEYAALGDTVRLVDMVTGDVYAIPENMRETTPSGSVILRHLPVCDYPLMLAFGDFVEIDETK